MSTFSKITFVLFIGIFSACKNDIALSPVEINKQYSIKVPDNSSRTTDINPKASLQFQDLVNNFYIIVIDESKSKLKDDGYEYSLNDYYDYSKQLLIDPNAHISITKPDSISVSGLQGLTSNLKGIMQQHEIYYKLAVVESPTHFYQIFMWTLFQQRDKYEKGMNDIIYSFTEL